MTDKATSDLWWKSAVIYCVDVKTFMDWNDDGVGDFESLPQPTVNAPTSVATVAVVAITGGGILITASSFNVR